MDFDLVLYIVLIVGGLLWTVVKNLKSEAAQPVKRNRSQTVTVETDDAEPQRPNTRNKARKVTEPQAKGDEYFTYETLSDRDFQQEFEENMEEHSAKAPTSQSDVKLGLNEEDVFKGVVWSEILQRKY